MISCLLSLTVNPTPEEEQARRISEMGKPILGEHSRLEVIIEESCEFKVCVEWVGGVCFLYYDAHTSVTLQVKWQLLTWSYVKHMQPEDWQIKPELYLQIWTNSFKNFEK